MSYDDLFHKNYRILLKFKRKFGTTNIPSRPGKNWFNRLSDNSIIELKTMGRFVETLRRQYIKNELLEYKIDMLNHIKFEWIPKSKQSNYVNFLNKIDKLKKFKSIYDHCNVPEKWCEDLELASFVSSSRYCYKKGKLSDHKINILNDIGFNWYPSIRERKRDKKGRYISNLLDN